MKTHLIQRLIEAADALKQDVVPTLREMVLQILANGPMTVDEIQQNLATLLQKYPSIQQHLYLHDLSATLTYLRYKNKIQWSHTTRTFRLFERQTSFFHDAPCQVLGYFGALISKELPNRTDLEVLADKVQECTIDDKTCLRRLLIAIFKRIVKPLANEYGISNIRFNNLCVDAAGSFRVRDVLERFEKIRDIHLQFISINFLGTLQDMDYTLLAAAGIWGHERVWNIALEILHDLVK